MAEGGYDPRYRNSDARSQQVCRFYYQNGCSKGDRCAYRHVRNRAPDYGVICKYYQLGCCTFGNKCKFIHESVDDPIEHLHEPAPAPRTGSNHSGGRLSSTELPSRMVTLRKGGNSDRNSQESDSDRSKKEFNKKWVQAQDFVPGKKFHGSVPSSYAKAVQPLKEKIEFDESSQGMESLLLCPYYEQTGHCPFLSECVYAHSDICDLCGLPKLHPTDQSQRDKHVQECIEEHEKQMELAFAVQASKDKECGICLENVMEKEWNNSSRSNKRFGILENCSHCFCLNCIRTWRQNKSDVIQTQRTCPTCRTHSDFVTPSKYWVELPEEKKKLIDDYKNAMKSKPCQYFKHGKGECPFDSRCFYRHALEDGTIVLENTRRRRNRFNADGERALENDFSLWDFISPRDIPDARLDAHLSLVLLGIFQDSDSDDDDNNNSFNLSSFLNGDYFIADSDTDDTESD